MYVACTYRLSFSIRKSVWDKREGKQLSEQSCWSWLGRAELSGEGLLHTPGWHCSAILALAALLSARLRSGGHTKGFPKHHQHPREKAQSVSQVEQVSLQLPLKQGMSMSLQQPLLCSSTCEPWRHCLHISTCCAHTSTCIGVIIQCPLFMFNPQELSGMQRRRLQRSLYRASLDRELGRH